MRTVSAILQVLDLLQEAGFETASDSERGFDHGVFVPMLLMSVCLCRCRCNDA
jgi:aromatic ring-opening dioxygenase catalytic subunit (LigB family)